jgi:flavin reductase (DIM6/NTAB) family NADH-FMN oxidoreductase RutF
MSIDQAAFRQALGHFATGVTVVTTSHNDALYGMTVSAFSSLSLEPPLVLICIQTTTTTYEALAEASAFAVNILADDQEHLSRHFATPQSEKFEGIAYTLGAGGCPLLGGVLATLECRIVERLPGGDHTIIVGEVEQSAVHDGTPLIYYRSGYGRFRP